jgi:hypothetical protein
MAPERRRARHGPPSRLDELGPRLLEGRRRDDGAVDEARTLRVPDRVGRSDDLGEESGSLVEQAVEHVTVDVLEIGE